MSDKYKNQTDVFRYIDTKGKGKVKKAEFITAVDKMKISLSREDVQAVFNKIDAHGVGFFTYQDLCAAAMRHVNLDSRKKMAMGEKMKENMIA